MSPVPFRNADDAARALAALPLADPREAQTALAQFFASLAATPLSPDARARLLDQLESGLEVTQEESARRLHGKALPYGAAEADTFTHNWLLWQALAEAWAACRREAQEPDGEALAKWLEREVFGRAQAVAAHLLARVEVPETVWLDLHESYRKAAALGLEQHPRQDGRGRNVSCHRHYAAVLLLDLAKPAALSPRDGELVWRWARQMGKFLGLLPLADSLSPFVVDPLSPTGVVKAGGPSREGLWQVDAGELAALLAKLRKRLRDNIPPAELKLGEDCSNGECQRLFSYLKTPWSLQAISRPLDYRMSHGDARVGIGYETIIGLATGKELAKPGGSRMGSTEHSRLFIFGTAGSVSTEAKRVLPSESWQVLEEGGDSLRIHRSERGAQLALGQLLAIEAESHAGFRLARVASVIQTREGGLVVKARLLDPGYVGVRLDHRDLGRALGAFWPGGGVGDDGEAEGPRLLLPRGWYQRQRVIEVEGEGRFACRLTQMSQGGADFDLALCTLEA